MNEISIQQKNQLGQGAYHTIYPSKLHPDKVIKTKNLFIKILFYRSFKTNDV